MSVKIDGKTYDVTGVVLKETSPLVTYHAPPPPIPLTREQALMFSACFSCCLIVPIVGASVGAYYSFKNNTGPSQDFLVLGIILSIGACIAAVMSCMGMVTFCASYNQR
jgi:hypothetical protein